VTAVAAVAGAAADRVWVECRSADGEVRSGPWSSLWPSRFESAVPWRVLLVSGAVELLGVVVVGDHGGSRGVWVLGGTWPVDAAGLPRDSARPQRSSSPDSPTCSRRPRD